MAHMTREQHTCMPAPLPDTALACVSNFISIATPASRIHIGNAPVLCGLILGPVTCGFSRVSRKAWAMPF